MSEMSTSALYRELLYKVVAVYYEKRRNSLMVIVSGPKGGLSFSDKKKR